MAKAGTERKRQTQNVSNCSVGKFLALNKMAKPIVTRSRHYFEFSLGNDDKRRPRRRLKLSPSAPILSCRGAVTLPHVRVKAGIDLKAQEIDFRRLFVFFSLFDNLNYFIKKKKKRIFMSLLFANAEDAAKADNIEVRSNFDTKERKSLIV